MMVDLGSTGLRVTPIGLGMAALGRPAYITTGRHADLGSDRSVAAMEARSHEMLDAAYQAGVRYVDAARGYGLAEQFLASWLRKRRFAAGHVVVGSKWGYRYTASWRLDAPIHELKDLSAANLDEQFKETIDLLDDHLRLFQIHSATIESGVLDDAAVLARLSRLRTDGLVIGLTVTGPRQSDAIRRALDVRVDGANPFQVVQATWNVLEPSAAGALADAKSVGWGVIVKEALANGRLTDRYDAGETLRVRREASVRGIAVDVLAMAAALSQPWADVVLSGAVTVDQLRSNLSALDVIDAARALPSMAMAPQDYWTQRAAMRWQ
jgi:aryl-alcohol dehydrogenase-like predicted oxidoreductase